MATRPAKAVGPSKWDLALLWGKAGRRMSWNSFLEVVKEHQPEASGVLQKPPSQAGWVVPTLRCFKMPQLGKTERELVTMMRCSGVRRFSG